MGKTALALGIASHVARSGSGVLFVSLEMSEIELGERFLSLHSGVEMSKIQKPNFAGDEEVDRLVAAVAPPGMPLWIDDSPSLTSTQVASMARRFKVKHDIGLVVVDYLQLVRPDDERTPRHEQVASISRRLKEVSGEINAPVLVLAQLNRDSEKRPDKRPLMSDLRESGQIEQDAHIVLLLHRPEYYKPTDQPGVAELIVAKNRNGATGTAELAFHKQSMSFCDLDHDRVF